MLVRNPNILVDAVGNVTAFGFAMIVTAQREWKRRVVQLAAAECTFPG